MPLADRSLSLPATRTPDRSLWPREHGAYGFLLLPLATALLSTRPGPAAGALALAGVGAFLGHEPMLVLLGHRGERARREQGEEAMAALATWAGLALLGLVLGAAWLPAEGRPLLLLALLLGGAALGLALGRAERTSGGEALAAAALSAWAAPVAVAGGAHPAAAATLAGIFAVAFGATTLGVRAVIANQKLGQRSAGQRARLALGCLYGLAGAAVAAAAGWLPRAVPVVLAPPLLLALTLALFPPHPRLLRQIGWAVMSSCLATTLLSLALFH